MTDSQKLVADYVERGSEAAFRELVTRYVDLVYSTAFRLVDRDSHLAQDVSQTVFVDLARMARTLSNDVMLGGWLHRHTCFVAAKTMRGERRRQSRERQAVEMNALEEHSKADFSEVVPLLDEAINELGEEDRKAVLLRFFEQYDFRKIGVAIGSNEDAARMRVNRAVEKLQSLLERRGVTSTAAALSMVLSVNAVQAAPIGLSIVIANTTLAATTAAGTASATSSWSLLAAMSTSKTFLIATLVMGVAFIPVGYHAHSARAHLAQTSNGVAVVPNLGDRAKARPSFESSAIFAEWKQLHETYGNTPESMPGIYQAINVMNDTTRRRAFQAALFAEWAQLDPRKGMDYLQRSARDGRQVEQFFQEWISRDPRVAVDFLLEGGAGWNALARASLNEIARRAPERLAETASRLPKEAGGWWDPVRKAFAIMGEVNPDAARQAAEEVTGPNREQALAGAAAAWARSDLGAAIAWAKALPDKLDHDEIIRGALVGKASTDPAAALDQLGLVPSGGRQGIFADTTGGRVLRTASAADYDATIAWIAAHPGRLREEDMLGLADAVSDRLNADPAGFLTRHAADNSLAAILPAVGSALINESGGQCAAVWDWLKQQPESPTVRSLRNDMLSGAGHQDADYAIKLAGEMPPGPEGDKQLSLLASSLINGGRFMDQMDGLLAKAPERFRQPLLQSAFQWLNGDLMTDPHEWIARLEMLPMSSRATGAHSISLAWADQAPEAALSWAGTLDEKLGRDAATAAVFFKWVARDADGAIAWVNAQPPGEERVSATRSLAKVLAMRDPQQAWNWGVSLDDSVERLTAASYVVDQLKLAGRVPAQALQWIEVAPFTAAEKSRLQNIIQGIRKSNP